MFDKLATFLYLDPSEGQAAEAVSGGYSLHSHTQCVPRPAIISDVVEWHRLTPILDWLTLGVLISSPACRRINI